MILKIRKQMTMERLLIGGFLLTVLVAWSYGASYWIYAGTLLALMAVVYFLYMLKFSAMDMVSKLPITVILCISAFLSIWNRDPKSMLMVNTSLLLPFVISTLSVDMENAKKAAAITTIVACCLIWLQVNYQVLGEINSNTLAFVAYIGISVGFLWFKLDARKIPSLFFLIVGLIVIQQTDCRNVAIVMPICFVLLLLPKKLLTNGVFYRVLYGLVLLYVIFAADIMEWGFSNQVIGRYLREYTAEVSEKAWDMETRMGFLQQVKALLSKRDILSKMFGEGVLMRHGHNLFYQCLMFYGYVGTTVIFAWFIRVFEMARTVLREKEDPITAGCVVTLLGHFMIQGADVYLLGGESCWVLPLIIIGIIMNRYRVYRSEMRQI